MAWPEVLLAVVVGWFARVLIEGENSVCYIVWDSRDQKSDDQEARSFEICGKSTATTDRWSFVNFWKSLELQVTINSPNLIRLDGGE